jgi:hypothetical protein
LVFLVGNVNVSGTTHVSGSVSGLGSVGAKSLVVPGSRTGANVCNLTAFVGVGTIVKPDALVERKRSTSNVDIAKNLFCGMRTWSRPQIRSYECTLHVTAHDVETIQVSHETHAGGELRDSL